MEIFYFTIKFKNVTTHSSLERTFVTN